MKKMKNIVCVLLAIAMCLGLTACGSGGADKAAAPSGGSTPEPSAAPEFTYVSEFEKLIENEANYNKMCESQSKKADKRWHPEKYQ